MCFGGGSSASDKYAKEQRQEERARKAQIQQGMHAIDQNFSKFDDDFYNGQAQHYLDFTMPQIDKQYTDAQRGLGYALARQGIGASSEGNRRKANLAGTYDLDRQAAVDKSRDVASKARSQIEAARSGLIQNLYATADPAAANQSSLSQAQYLATPQSVSPIGDVFANTLAGLNTYQSAKNDAQQYYGALQSAGISAPQSSGRNIGG